MRLTQMQSVPSYREITGLGICHQMINTAVMGKSSSVHPAQLDTAIHNKQSFQITTPSSYWKRWSVEDQNVKGYSVVTASKGMALQ